MSSGIVFHAVAALAYAVLAVSLWRRLASTDGIQHAGRVARTCLTGALFLQGVALYQSVLGGPYLFIGWALAMSAAIWLGMVIFWLESLVVRIDGLLLLLLPAAAFVCALAGAFPQGQVVPHANSSWLRVHLVIALMAYGLMTVAAVQAMLMALLDRHLHRPVEEGQGASLMGKVLDVQPPLLMQERLLFRIISVGFAVLTLTVITGSVASYMLTQRMLPFDHKTVFTLLSWLTFGVLLLGRYLKGWRGRVALRWTLSGFALLLLAYTGSRFVLEVLLHRS
ncbi:hypothetical protein AKI39_01940 [Bordetella sp. H567]|uniref:cytochrome C assembly family protein n=1 Tax=Bordetella sp. H567 TaxID=1697043 RepID=UPI00081CDA19|nr:cytochrome c biogenesis protein CcsA [Bordetella sp. H567]AOB29707.1 hypothetical protein AKI39_01940 [Bordetella sp. H567]